MSELLKGLNETQKEAATHIDGALLILAGAGSGKTKTITTRLAYLIDEVGIDANSVLTLTFTNKAASVMRLRALSLLKKSQNTTPLLCTFHKFGLLFLRLYIEKIKRKNDFVVIDTDDGKKIIKDILADKSSASSVLAKISSFKNNFESVEMIFDKLKLIRAEEREKFELVARAYKHYEEALIKNNLLDFDDLLLKSYEILSADKAFAKKISQKHGYIMVDEYQDTNALQFELLRLLCSAHQNLAVVGDDDQSIYAWRGAKIENILNFEQEFENVKVIKLQHNYRSNALILDAANALIRNNQQRLGKTLIATKAGGEALKVLENNDERNESEEIVKIILKKINSGTKPNEIAVLYRINALSRSLEEALMRAKVPFKILSGVRFFERAEIKCTLSYLRFLNNTNDDFSFKAIINTPKRGFGQAGLKKLEEVAKIKQISLYEALILSLENALFSSKIASELNSFVQKIEKLKELSSLEALILELESEFLLKKYFKEENNGDERAQNLDELYALLKDKIKVENLSLLSDLLSELSLQSDQDGVEGESVFLMSIHASKGLEFDCVFVVGLEEGFFPLDSQINELEEERRLAYVAITRARKELILSFVNSRLFRGDRVYDLKKSRFLAEIEGKNSENFENKEQSFKKGDLIKHKIFGIGRIISIEKTGSAFKLGINFGGITRFIMSNFVEKI